MKLAAMPACLAGGEPGINHELMLRKGLASSEQQFTANRPV